MNEAPISGLDTLTTPPASDQFWTELHDRLMATTDADLVGGSHPELVALTDGNPAGRARPWRLLTAAAAFIAIVAGLTVYTLARPGSSTPAERTNGVITDPTMIDLDPWRPAGYEADASVGGPYEVFDVTKLPAGWSMVAALPTAAGTDFVGAGNPVDWSWRAALNDPTGTTWVLFVQAPREGDQPSIDSTGDDVAVRGTTGVVADNTLSWIERGVLVMIHWQGVDQRDTAIALADGLVASTTSELIDPPSTGEAMSEPTPTLLGGVIDGVRWWVDTRTTALSDSAASLSLVAAGAVQGQSGGPTDPIGFGDVGLPGHGRIYFGRTAADLGSIRVALSDQTTIVLPVAHEATTTLFAIPLPFGLDAVSIDYIATDGTVLKSRRLPPLTDAVGASFSQDSL